MHSSNGSQCQAALAGHDLSRTYLAHHELESVFINIIIKPVVGNASLCSLCLCKPAPAGASTSSELSHSIGVVMPMSSCSGVLAGDRRIPRSPVMLFDCCTVVI